uniref:Aldose 1-epimerase n=1 Tax=Macrostomum lignano TaxID=282301 RepID=A0A1I8I5I9_9PLAT
MRAGGYGNQLVSIEQRLGNQVPLRLLVQAGGLSRVLCLNFGGPD